MVRSGQGQGLSQGLGQGAGAEWSFRRAWPRPWLGHGKPGLGRSSVGAAGPPACLGEASAMASACCWRLLEAGRPWNGPDTQFKVRSPVGKAR